MDNYSKHLPQRILLSMVFAIAFAVVGKFIPEIYFRYFDRTVYYFIEQPISVDKTVYKPCEITRVTINSVALVDITGWSVVDLVLIRADNKLEKVAAIQRVSAIPKGERTLIVDWPLPCDISDGIYYWQAVIKYDVRGIQKTYSYLTDTFMVISE